MDPQKFVVLKCVRTIRNSKYKMKTKYARYFLSFFFHRRSQQWNPIKQPIKGATTRIGTDYQTNKRSESSSRHNRSLFNNNPTIKIAFYIAKKALSLYRCALARKMKTK